MSYMKTLITIIEDLHEIGLSKEVISTRLQKKFEISKERSYKWVEIALKNEED